ncbi:hypothetical protein LINPERHAP1_LOCUS30259 [Linum perenne]
MSTQGQVITCKGCGGLGT